MTTPTVPLKKQALDAYAAEKAAAEAAQESARTALRAAATAALKATLVRPDGTALTLAEAKLSSVESQLDVAAQSGRVVWSDGTLHLAAIKRADAPVWRVVLVENDGGWTRRSEPLSDLADLGAALDAMEG